MASNYSGAAEKRLKESTLPADGQRVGTSFKITREEILKVYAAGPEAVIALIEGIVEQQEQRITALEQELQELKKDSHDSGKPPSRDSFERKQLHRKQTRRKRTTAKRPGGQPEHAGATLRQVAQPDTITIHPAENCTGATRPVGVLPAPDL